MEKPKTTAKDFFLWAGAMVTFYWSVIAFILLTFDYINYSFPNALSYFPADPYQSGISYEMASIIVLLPLYLLLMRLIHKDASVDPSRNEIWVRKWALILTLFVAGVAITIDLITLLTTFLNGEELALAFLLKILVVLLVAGGVFMHFIADLKGYWDAAPKKRQMIRVGVAILALVTILSGFVIVGSPRHARLARFDAQKVSDLQNIQSQVVSYWQAKRALPKTLGELSNPLQYGYIPVDSQSGTNYRYEATGDLTFKVCAVFNTEGDGNQYQYKQTVMIGSEKQDNWSHGVGEVCFDRNIDPAFYPPLNKI